MRILIIGGGQVGYGLSQALAARHEVVVVDRRPTADRFGWMSVRGGGTSRDTLRRAGIERADVFIACTGLDEVNIVAWHGESDSRRAVCFVSARFLRLSKGGRAGAFRDRPRGVAGGWLADDIGGSCRRRRDRRRNVRGRGRAALEVRLEAGSPLVASASPALPHGSLLVAVRRGDEFFIPRGETRLASGDKAIVMGTPDAMADVQSRMMQGLNVGRQSVTIIGGGDVGLRLAERLDTVSTISLRVIGRQKRGETLAARLHRALVLQGNGTDLALLESEDIGRSDVLVSVIDNDEKNLLASLLGRQLGVKRIITRVSEPANLRLFERVGVDVAISGPGRRRGLDPPSDHRRRHQPAGGHRARRGAGVRVDRGGDVCTARAEADGHRPGRHRRRHPARGPGHRPAR
jgi:trk system potassium uptake protein TrkA